MMDNDIKLEVYETQETIILLQTEIINSLFSLLSQHIDAEELDNLPVVEKINEAARLRKE